MPVLEICVDSYESAIRAFKGGANRLEVCDNLDVGGLTPSAGIVTYIRKAVSIPVFALIRPRPGNFQYSTEEIEQMMIDIRNVRKAGASGVVFGALNSKNEVDLNACLQLLGAASCLPVTFHRAFDVIENKFKALDDIIKLKFQRILTCGGPSGKAATNRDALRHLRLQAMSRILIMPGGDVDETNILDILHDTQVVEFHSSAREKYRDGSKSEFASEDRVKKMRAALDNLWDWTPPR